MKLIHLTDLHLMLPGETRPMLGNNDDRAIYLQVFGGDDRQWHDTRPPGPLPQPPSCSNAKGTPSGGIGISAARPQVRGA